MKGYNAIRRLLVVIVILAASAICVSRTLIAKPAAGPVCPDGRILCANDANGHIFHKGNPIGIIQE